MTGASRWQAAALVLLRTLMGWHFLYEGYYKLALPGWSSAGAPLPAWSAAGYLRGATGPLAGLYHALAASMSLAWIDTAVPLLLVAVGLSLILGLFTQAGAFLALVLLTLFYAAMIPLNGSPAAGAEGSYLIVNKTLVEWAAALVVLTSRTGRIAGLDVLRFRSGLPAGASAPAPAAADR
jgi:thiosulfate dehydrogenase [quinone] large subunit